jgi:hypothetical protein
MNQPPISSATQRRYEEIAAGLAGAGVKASSMFGMPTLKLNGKAIGGLGRRHDLQTRPRGPR